MKICLDAGHNYSGYNTGAVGCGIREQDITFQIADRVRVRLERLGIDVVMTRPTLKTNLGTSNSTSLTERCRIANESDCDLFISIHCNAGGGSGVEVLTFKENSEADKFAWIVQYKIVEALALANRGVKYRPELAVLRNTKMPAVLIETAFIDNGIDAYKLVNNQEDFVAAIEKAVIKYFNLGQENTKANAMRIIKEKCDTPKVWLDRLDTIPYFAEFVCKIGDR